MVRQILILLATSGALLLFNNCSETLDWDKLAQESFSSDGSRVVYHKSETVPASVSSGSGAGNINLSVGEPLAFQPDSGFPPYTFEVFSLEGEVAIDLSKKEILAVGIGKAYLKLTDSVGQFSWYVINAISRTGSPSLVVENQPTTTNVVTAPPTTTTTRSTTTPRVTTTTRTTTSNTSTTTTPIRREAR